jgi:hypothetical protein
MKNSTIAAVIVLILIAVALYYFSNAPDVIGDPYSIYYDGVSRRFRGDLFEANKTPVFPSEDSVKNLLLNPEVYKIQISYIPNENENAYYLATTYEITSKLSLVYRHYFTGQVQTFKDEDNSSCLLFYDDMQTRCFKSVALNFTQDLVPTPVEPAILLLGPSQANDTSVRVENNVIVLSGKSFDETNRTYTDLDLSVDKMLLILMT